MPLRATGASSAWHEKQLTFNGKASTHNKAQCEKNLGCHLQLAKGQQLTDAQPPNANNEASAYSTAEH